MKKGWELTLTPEFSHFIIAPHPDDEFIGMHGLLTHKDLHKTTAMIVHLCDSAPMTSPLQQALREKESAAYINIINGRADKPVCDSISITTRSKISEDGCCSSAVSFICALTQAIYRNRSLRGSDKTVVVWMPDPTYDTHPWHKAVSYAILSADLPSTVMIGLYSTDMNTPYVQVLSGDKRIEKESVASKYYPSQKGYFENQPRSLWMEGRILL